MKEKSKILKVIKVLARISSVVMTLMFIVFFVGEGVINDLAILTTTEIILLLLIPGVLTIGALAAWKSELIGGIIISTSIVAFNIIDMLVSKDKIFSPNFWLFLIIGVMFIIVGINKKKYKL